jgi:hypothetical protein
MQTKPRREFAATWKRMKVSGKANPATKEFMGQLSDRYNLHRAYENAHAKKNPYLSPHGFFRRLQSGDNEHAKKFLETFGPLELDAGKRLIERAHVGVNLDKFWSLHRRFWQIAELWESLDDRKQLEAGLLYSYIHRQVTPKYDIHPLGQIFGPPPEFEKRGVYEFPWEVQGQEAQNWLGSARMEEMRACALQLILLELNAHTHKLAIRWERGWEVTGRGFREVVWVDSLWSAIWESWGWDTKRLSWRRCPHCQTYFYPKRIDQICCTRRQQTLWSKRRYAAEQRYQEHQRKRIVKSR